LRRFAPGQSAVSTANNFAEQDILIVIGEALFDVIGAGDDPATAERGDA